MSAYKAAKIVTLAFSNLTFSNYANVSHADAQFIIICWVVGGRERVAQSFA